MTSMAGVRRLVGVAVIAAAIAGCAGHQTRSSSAPSLAVGAPITVTAPVSIAALAADPAPFEGQTVRLEGTVSSVCQGMGCWAEVKAADGSTFLAKSLDESVLLPKNCAGRKIVVQGVVTRLPSAAASEPAAEGHACPRPDYVVATSGARLD